MKKPIDFLFIFGFAFVIQSKEFSLLLGDFYMHPFLSMMLPYLTVTLFCCECSNVSLKSLNLSFEMRIQIEWNFEWETI